MHQESPMVIHLVGAPVEAAEWEVKSLEKTNQHDGKLWMNQPGKPGALRDQDRSLVRSREKH